MPVARSTCAEGGKGTERDIAIVAGGVYSLMNRFPEASGLAPWVPGVETGDCPMSLELTDGQKGVRIG